MTQLSSPLPATWFQSSDFHVRMTGPDTLTISARLTLPIGGTRWMQIYKGAPDSPELRALAESFLDFSTKLCRRLPEPDDDDRAPWHADVYEH